MLAAVFRNRIVAVALDSPVVAGAAKRVAADRSRPIRYTATSGDFLLMNIKTELLSVLDALDR